jgi:oligopeptide/dipeptide ABC transporter ATP-binding protein
VDTLSRADPPVIAADRLFKRFGRRGQPIHAVNGVSLRVHSGEIVGLVGESGCGKSTLSRMLVGIESISAGRVLRDGVPVETMEDWRQLRRHVQYVFQDPFGSLCPTMTIGDALVDPLTIHRIGTRAERRERAAEMLQLVGLSASDMRRLPAQFSGGQRQRISIARALILDPQVVICDEIVSGLDVSIQAQVLNLLLELYGRFRLGMLFISHDLRVIHYLCDRVAVMYLGQIVEEGPAAEVFDRPQHPYTRGLLESIPDHAPHAAELRARVPGEPPSLAELPPGCPFSGRCPIEQRVCRDDAPELRDVFSGHAVRCHFPADGAMSPAAARVGARV